MRALLIYLSAISVGIVNLAFVIQVDPIIYSSENKLEWTNFEASAPDSAEFSALTIVNFRISTQVLRVRETMIVEIEAFMEPDKSYVKKGMETEYLLNHEQRHFDIAELYARKLRMEISKMKYSTSIQDSVISAYHSSHVDYKQFQTKYDEETNHSGDKVKQNEWDVQIDSLLNVYKDYKDVKIAVIK